MSYSSEVLADSPVGYWHLDESSGTSAADSSGNSRNGTYVGTPTLAATSLLGTGGGTAVTLNGTSQRVSVATNNAFNITSSTSTHTFECWVKITSPSSAALQIIADKTNLSTANRQWAIYWDNRNVGAGTVNNLRFRYNDAAGALLDWSGSTPAAALAAGGHLVCVVDTTNVYMYWNGSLVASSSKAAGLVNATGTQTLSFGARSDGAAFWLGGTIDEIAIYPTALSSTRVSDHYAAASAAAGTGTVNAQASSPAVSISGTVTTLGTVTAAASAPTVLVSGVLPTTGTVTATASAPDVVVAGNVADITGGTVQATASAPTILVSGTVPTGVTGTVSATASAPSLTVTDSTLSTEVAVGVTVEAGTLTVTTVVTLDGTEAAVGTGIDVGTLVVIEVLEGTSIPIGLSLVGRPVPGGTPDPRTGIDQWRYVVTDLQGAALGELVDIEHDPVEDGINQMAGMSFTIAMDDPDRAMIQPVSRQCQVWKGDTLLLRGPFDAGQASEDGTTITHKVNDPSWWWRDGRALIGRTPALNLLRNGDFDQSLNYWTLGHDADSIPASNPTVRVVSDPFTGPDGHAAEIVGVESVTITESELSSNAVFWPNLATFRPGGVAAIEAVANAMPTTAGLKVSVVGHTANDGTGPGWDLSLRRANAAKAIIQGKRPSAVITTKGVGYTDPKPGYPIDSQAQRRVVISYESTTTISAKSKQWMRQTITVTQPKAAAYPLVLAAAAWLKITDDWSVEDANMVAVKIVARRQSAPSKPWDDQLGVGEASISDTDPQNRWLKESAEVTIPADGRPYLVDVYLYAPAALARYTRVILEPQEMLYFWGVDQALIVKGIIEHMQSPITKMGRVWPITVGTRTPLTGVQRDKSYPYSERMPVETALDQLASLYNGVDIDVPPHMTETVVATYHPRQGQVVDYVLAQGGNVVRAVPATTNDVGSLVIAQAQDSSAVRDEAYAIDPKAFGGMILHRLITAEQDTPISELDETAAAELGWSKVTTASYWLDIDPEAIAEVLAETAKGDTVRMILDFPNALDVPARIVQRQIHPNGLRLMVALQEA